MVSFDFSGPGFGEISTQMVRSTLKGRMILVDPCFEDLITARAILKFNSRLDRNIEIRGLTNTDKISSNLFENNPSSGNPM